MGKINEFNVLLQERQMIESELISLEEEKERMLQRYRFQKGKAIKKLREMHENFYERITMSLFEFFDKKGIGIKHYCPGEVYLGSNDKIGRKNSRVTVLISAFPNEEIKAVLRLCNEYLARDVIYELKKENTVQFAIAMVDKHLQDGFWKEGESDYDRNNRD